MSSTWLLDLLAAAYQVIKAGIWPLVAFLFDGLRSLGGLGAGLVVLVLSLLVYFLAHILQRRLNKRLSADPRTPVELWKEDLWLSLPGLLIRPFFLIGALVKALYVWLRAKIRRQETPAEEPASARYYVAATLGPSYLAAALVTAAVYLAALLIEPLLRGPLGLSPGAPAWQYLWLGHRPELAAYLPLDRYPFFGGLLVFLLWLGIWSWTARLVRWIYRKELGNDLFEQRDDPQTLAWWRGGCAVRDLVRPAATYRAWAAPLLAIAFPLLIWAWLSVGGTTYRTGGSTFAVGWLLWLSWVLHLRLRGAANLPEDAKTAGEAAPMVEAHGWSAVLSELESRLQVGEPRPFRASRPIGELQFSTYDPAADRVLSPLLDELLKELDSRDDPALTDMQRSELQRLAILGHVRTRPPAIPGKLELPEEADTDDRSEVERRRNRIVIAPEGWGKTTLAMLAACNHALVHTRGTLIVVRDEQQAKALQNRFRHNLDSSTLRWNVRLRRVDDDLVNDLAQGIVPDVVTCDLRSLVVHLLDRVDAYAPFLRHVGLIVVDDAESFAGPVETHAQLAFRRMKQVFRDQLGVTELGEPHAPMFLALTSETMHKISAWVCDLCGIEAGSKSYGYSQQEARLREAAARAAEGLSTEGEKDAPDDPGRRQEAIEGGPHQRFYRLVDFKTAHRESLRLPELVESCERLAVPWHYRLCGDYRRHIGLQALHLANEPEYFRQLAEEACVVFLEGQESEVRREIRRLRRAGAGFSRFRRRRSGGGVEGVRREPPEGGAAEGQGETIAIVTLIDRDEEMALTERDTRSELAELLATLPRPVLRPPTGRTFEAHLAADLVLRWIEVGDLVDVYGGAVAHTLRRLAAEDLLLTEERVDVKKVAFAYENRLYVRALSRAVADKEEDEVDAALPLKVAQVDLTSDRFVHLVDRNSMLRLGTADADSANLVYYQGGILTNANGRYMVVGLAAEEGEAAQTSLATGDILLEPTLVDELTSPRRRIRVKIPGSWVPGARQPEPEADSGEPGPSGAAGEASAPAPEHLELLDWADAQRRQAAGDELPATRRSPLLGRLYSGPDPVHIGQYPIAVALAPVGIATEHFATYRLEPRSGEVRQRYSYDQDSRRRFGTTALVTEALCLYPNPAPLDGQLEEGRPLLAFAEARLIAAAMRLVLPSMYRGAQDNIEVALHLTPREGLGGDPLGGLEGSAPEGRAIDAAKRDADPAAATPPPDYVLEPDEGFVLFDLNDSGNGTARAIFRDGVEPLLRLVRMVLERVLSHRRLLALYDHWGDASELLPDEERRAQAADETSWDHDFQRRRRALTWLDSHLRPEGGPAATRAEAEPEQVYEPGEGDPFDAGRCWYSPQGEVDDLVWVKHRWRLADGGESALDVAFDRETAEESRFFTEDSQVLAQYHEYYQEQLANEDNKLPDGTTWGAPRVVWMAGDNGKPRSSQGDPAGDEGIDSYHSLASAVAAHTWPALGPLAQKLRLDFGVRHPETAGRFQLATYLSRFVQGIPYSLPEALRRGLRPPVSTLLFRRGDCDSKSLLLAILLKRCGIDAGLFLSFEEKHAVCAAAVPEPLALDVRAQTVHRDDEGKFATEEDAAGGPEHYQRSTSQAKAMLEHLRAWHRSLGQPEPQMWAELPIDPKSESPVSSIYVPIESTVYSPVGGARVGDPGTWCFLPLEAIWRRIRLTEGPAAADQAEFEV